MRDWSKPHQVPEHTTCTGEPASDQLCQVVKSAGWPAAGVHQSRSLRSQLALLVAAHRVPQFPLSCLRTGLSSLNLCFHERLCHDILSLVGGIREGSEPIAALKVDGCTRLE